MTLLISRLCIGLLITATIFSCKKNNTGNKATNNLGALNGTWVNTSFGGINGNVIKFVVNPDDTTGVITQLGSSAFGFTTGETLFSGITPTGSGTYSSMGTYTFGTNNATTSTRSDVMTLQNNDTQLTVDYPALNVSFPEIIYVYQKQ